MKDNVKKIDKCYSCTACYNICPKKCISMQEDKKGFLEPTIDEDKCINCKLCLNICPRNKDYRQKYLEQKSFLVKNKDEEIRNKSTSGGFFSLVADCIIKNNGVIYGCIVNEALKIEHIRVTKDYSKMRGSKYVQSNLGNTFQNVKKDLDAKKLVLFTGTPCQCAGLKAFLRKDYDNLILLDFICHGPQSPLIWQDYIEYLTNKNGKIKNYYFRSKINGWHKHTEVVEYQNGKIEYDTLDTNILKEIFYTDYSLKNACYDCGFSSLDRVSDLTMADAWGIQNENKDLDDNLGTSLILVNSLKGYKIFNELLSKINYKECDINKYIPYNPRLIKKNKIEEKKINEFWHIYEKKGFKGIIKKYTGYNYKKKIKKRIKSILIKLKIYNN